MCLNCNGYSSSVKSDMYQEQDTKWDGVEIRLLQLISNVLNFSLVIHDASLSTTR